MKVFLPWTFLSMTIAATCFGQTLPPANPILLLRADKGVAVTNGRVATWQDQSDSHHDVHQINTDHQPVLIMDTSNAHSALEFDGYQYFEGPTIFPVSNDYSIFVIVRLSDTTVINNLVSGEKHALFYPNSTYAHVVHTDFSLQEGATIRSWAPNYSLVIARYSEATHQAKLYINGQLADSSYVGSNPDSSLYIGSYIRGYFLKGAIEELGVYSREISEAETRLLSETAMTEYHIRPAPPLPPPDSTFSVMPKPMQLFSRGADDSSTVTISGRMYEKGFDSIVAMMWKNSALVRQTNQALHFSDGSAPFGFQFRIHAEPSEYNFEVHGFRSGRDSLLRRAVNVVSGDLLLIDGQSNANYGYDNPTYSNEFIRCFGINYSQNRRDTAWAVATTSKWSDGPGVSGWGQRIQRNILEQEHIPTCCINGSVAGTSIQSHIKNFAMPYDLRSIYGRMLYRVDQSGLARDAKILIWDQGELNYATGYIQEFDTLYRSWKSDYPNLQRIYLLQMRPNFCSWGNIDMRNVQRNMGRLYPDIDVLAMAALYGHDGCHYHDTGLNVKGDRIFKSIARDFYHSSDTDGIRSSNEIGAYFSNKEHSEVTIVFTHDHNQLSSTPDSIILGVHQGLKDYLYFDDAASKVESIDYKTDTIVLHLNGPSKALNVSYTYDQYYKGFDSNIVYEGPWLVNQRGIGAMLFYQLPISNAPLSSIRPTDATVRVVYHSANKSLAISADSNGIIEYALYDILGRSVMRGSEAGPAFSLDVSSLHPGVYFFRSDAKGLSADYKFTLGY